MVIKIQYTAHNRDKLNFLLRQTIMAKTLRGDHQRRAALTVPMSPSSSPTTEYVFVVSRYATFTSIPRRTKRPLSIALFRSRGLIEVKKTPDRTTSV
jgi:hypothetical protein